MVRIWIRTEIFEWSVGLEASVFTHSATHDADQKKFADREIPDLLIEK